jgi:hypothetical protein
MENTLLSTRDNLLFCLLFYVGVKLGLSYQMQGKHIAWVAPRFTRQGALLKPVVNQALFPFVNEVLDLARGLEIQRFTRKGINLGFINHCPL